MLNDTKPEPISPFSKEVNEVNEAARILKGLIRAIQLKLMVSVMWLCNGLKATFLAVGNIHLSKLIKHVLQRRPLRPFILHIIFLDLLNYLENVLNNELPNIDVWLRSNKLSINTERTNNVLFIPSQRRVNFLWRSTSNSK